MTLVSEAAARTSGTVPVIDISAYFGGSESDKQRIAQEIGEACRTIGFLLITGHGIPDEVIHRTEATGRGLWHGRPEYLSGLLRYRDQRRCL
jgi:hypothetical protein